MLEIVEKFIQKHQLIEKGTTVVVGVSGGPDSIALLHFLWVNRLKWDLDLIGVHVDHMFRGKQSEEDYKFVQDYCRLLHVTFEGTQVNVPFYQKQNDHTNAQDAARECRYQFFDQMMRKYQADYLALAHHGDDQVETMLMRQVRGSFISGISGMQAKRPFSTGEVIRPFLSVTKDEIITYCQDENLKVRIDPTNQKDTYTRNRFRRYVLPFLKNENPNVHQRFQYLSECLRDDQVFLEDLAKEKLNEVIVEKGQQEMVLSIEEMDKLPISLQRRCFHLILNYLYHEKHIKFISSVHIEKLILFMKGFHPSGTLHFPRGLRVIKSYHKLTLTYHAKKTKKAFEEILHIPGELDFSDKFKIGAKFITDIDHLKKVTNNMFLCHVEGIQLPIIVRTRKPGDRMTLKGMTGTKKLKDIFIDLKVPIEERDEWPVISDSNGNILWLPQLKKSSFEIFNRHKGNNSYILLYYK